MAIKQNNNFNLADPAFLANPAPMLAEMRAQGPLVKIKLPIVGAMWATTTYAATAEVAKGKDRFFLTGQGAGLKKKGNASLQWWMPPSFKAMAQNMLGKDDPEHRRLRKLVDQAFARRGIRDMRPKIADIAAGHVAALGQGDVDLVPLFCRRFPLDVIAELLGLPEKDRAVFAGFAGTLGELSGPRSIFKMLRAVSKMNRYLGHVIVKFRQAPQPGLIADLIAAEEAGDKLSQEELVAMVFLLLFAGFETTTNLISGSVLALDRNPDQQTWLFKDFEARIESATEELCRYVSSIGGTKPRVAAMDTSVEGQMIRRGERVMALPIAANFDPAVFEEADQLRLDRFPNPHLAFSTGNHFCLGMQLARVELQEALRALYGTWPELQVNDESPRYVKRPGHRALAELNVTLA